MSGNNRSYFYKADDFPEVIVNERRELKSLANSCHIHLPRDAEYTEVLIVVAITREAEAADIQIDMSAMTMARVVIASTTGS